MASSRVEPLTETRWLHAAAESLLRAEIDTGHIEAYRGTTSLPFEASAHQRLAVEIVDDRGVESLTIIPVL